MNGTSRFLLFFVGAFLVLASALLAFPGGPAYEQSFSHEATLDELPSNDAEPEFYEHLTIRQQKQVDRAIDGETITVPGHRRLPPEYVYHRERSEIYRFEKQRYYDTGRTAGKAGILAFVLGVAAIGGAIRMEHSR